MNGNGPQLFEDTATALQYLKNRYGAVDWSSYEYIRQEFWSYQIYPEAGAPTFNFFGQTTGGTITDADTNMDTAGMFQSGQHFLVNAIRCKLRITTDDISTWAGADNDTLVSDLLNGFAQCGVLTWNINAMNYLSLPNPFLWAPSAGGEPDFLSAGSQATTIQSAPWVTLLNNREGELILQPQVLLENGVTFGFQIAYPTGAVPIIGTDITNDSTNPLKIGVEISGQWFRPMQ